MKKIRNKIWMLIVMICSSIMGITTFAAELPSVTIPVEISLTGTYPEIPEAYTVNLTANDSSNPMPEGSVNGVYPLTITGAGTVSFPAITYDRLGIYTYTIQQTAGLDTNCTYDTTAYTMTVSITNSEAGNGLEATAVLYAEGQDSKLPGVSLVNRYLLLTPEGYYYGGTLTITKKTVMDGKAYPMDGVFHAGVFTDAALTDRLGTVLALDLNGKSSVSVPIEVSIGQSEDDSATFYIAETDQNGIPLKNDGTHPFEVSVNMDGKITLSPANPDGEVIITNTFEEEIETEYEEMIETEEEYEEETEPETERTRSLFSPGTGDDTPIILYAALMAAALLLLIATVIFRRRRTRR